jgi:hypothetical protein
MKIKLTTWRSMLARYGDYEARRHLRCLQKGRGLFRVERDPFSLIHDLVHLWPGRSPTENRKKFAVPIRGLLREIRRRRERTNALCAPGMSLQRLP